jgi:uncharacterized protein YndB with AHSA1/START domain
MIAGDQARAQTLVRIERALAFRVFTEEIDAWWRKGPQYRVSRGDSSILHIEPFVGGRLFEAFDGPRGPKTVQTGTVKVWDPPARLVFEWRAVNFKADEKTEVEVLFEERPSGTMVTVTHSGFSAIRPDHPVRHGHDVPAFVRMMGMWWGGLLNALREHANARVASSIE